MTDSNDRAPWYLIATWVISILLSYSLIQFGVAVNTAVAGLIVGMLFAVVYRPPWLFINPTWTFSYANRRRRRNLIGIYCLSGALLFIIFGTIGAGVVFGLPVRYLGSLLAVDYFSSYILFQIGLLAMAGVLFGVFMGAVGIWLDYGISRGGISGHIFSLAPSDCTVLLW